jgi:hypothetical protein
MLKIIPITNHGEDIYGVSTYRPISLIPILAKLAGSLVKDRLTRTIKRLKLIPIMSMGIKKGGVNQTSQNTRKGKTTVIAFLDLSAAFDNVKITKLLQIHLQVMKIEDDICVWNHICLVGRTLMIQTNTFEVTKKYIVLSPITNFILYTIRNSTK